MGIKKDKTNLTQLMTVLKYQLQEIATKTKTGFKNENIIIIGNKFYCNDNNELVFGIETTDLITSEIDDGIFVVSSDRLLKVLQVCNKPHLYFNKTNSYKSFPMLEIIDGGGHWYFPYENLSKTREYTNQTDLTPIKMVSTCENVYKKSDFDLLFKSKLPNHDKHVFNIENGFEVITNGFFLQVTKTDFYKTVGNCKISIKEFQKYQKVFETLFNNEIIVKNCGDYICFESNGIELNIRKQYNLSIISVGMDKSFYNTLNNPKQEIEINKKEIDRFLKNYKVKESFVPVIGNQKITFEDYNNYVYTLPVKTKNIFNYFTKQVVMGITDLIKSFDFPELINISIDLQSGYFATLDKNNNLIGGMCWSPEPKYKPQ